MSTEISLITRIARTGDITPAREFGISVDDFTEAVPKSLWLLLDNLHTARATRGSVASVAQLERVMQGQGGPLQDYYPHMTTAALCDLVRRNRLRIEAQNAVVQFSTAIGENRVDLHQSLGTLYGELQRLIALGTAGNTDVGIHAGLTTVMRQLEAKQRGDVTSVMRWPWSRLQEVTFGLQHDDTVIFYGRPKSMKTWVMCALVAAAFHQDRKVLIFTKEMTPANMYARLTACILSLYYNELREGTIDALEQDSLKQMIEMVTDPYYLDRFVVLSGADVAPGGDTPGWLRGKIDRYKPAVVFIDGMYLLTPDGGGKTQRDDQRAMNISRQIRRITLDMGVPIIGTMQANRKAAGHSNANTDEVAYSDAFAQDATILIRVIADKTSPTISLVIGGSREFKLHGIRIHGVPARDFSFHSELTEAEIEKAANADAASDAETKKPKKANKIAPAVEHAATDAAPIDEAPTGSAGPSLRVPQLAPEIAAKVANFARDAQRALAQVQ